MTRILYSNTLIAPRYKKQSLKRDIYVHPKEPQIVLYETNKDLYQKKKKRNSRKTPAKRTKKRYGMKKALCMLMILFFITMGTANAELFNDLDRAVTEYNAYYKELPSSIKILLGNEDILAGILMNDGSELKVWLVTKDGRVTDLEKVEDASDYNPTVIIATDEDTVRSLITTADPLPIYEAARASGAISIDPVSFVSKAKFAVTDLAFKLLKTTGFF